MSDYLTDYISRSSNVKVELDLKSYSTKEELKNITHDDTSFFALETNLASLKTKVHKLDIPKFNNFISRCCKVNKRSSRRYKKKTDFNSLRTKVDQNKTDNDNLETKVSNNDKTTKTSINNLKTKVDSIDVSKYVLKINYDTKIGNLELKIPDISGLLQTSSFNS